MSTNTPSSPAPLCVVHMFWSLTFGGIETMLVNIANAQVELLLVHKRHGSGTPDFPFCLGWANHSCTRHTWDVMEE